MFVSSPPSPASLLTVPSSFGCGESESWAFVMEKSLTKRDGKDLVSPPPSFLMGLASRSTFLAAGLAPRVVLCTTSVWCNSGIQYWLLWGYVVKKAHTGTKGDPNNISFHYFVDFFSKDLKVLIIILQSPTWHLSINSFFSQQSKAWRYEHIWKNVTAWKPQLQYGGRLLKMFFKMKRLAK